MQQFINKKYTYIVGFNRFLFGSSRKKLYIIFFLNFLFGTNFGQETVVDSISGFSLEELKNYGVEHNYDVLNAELEIKKSKALKWETTAMGLPQVSGSVQYQNFPDIPTQLMPDFLTPAVYGVNTELFGLSPIAPMPEDNKFPVQFGSKHNADWGVSVSQLVFSGEYIVGLKASKIYLDLSKKAKEKSIIDIKENIEKTFYLILITEESISVTDSVIEKTSSLLNEQQKMFEAGFLEETDVEQLKLNLKNTENALISLKKNKDIFYRLLKFQTGMDYSSDIKLNGSLEDVISEIEENNLFMEDFNIYENIDYQLMEVQENLADLSFQREKTKFLPSVYAFYSYKEQAMRDSLDFFSSDAEWYPTSVWGVQVSIPIFSSGLRYAKVKQAQFELEKKHNSKLKVEQALFLETEQAKSEFLLSINKVRNNSEQRHLAKKIFDNSYKKFKTGTELSFNLTLNQTQYFNALGGYYQALGDLIEKHIKLKKLMNQL
ncbi:MAG: TolC family protein [Bacteroidales bacterium]|nr:TolC family protein [Bacteroidales bacterium]